MQGIEKSIPIAWSNIPQGTNSLAISIHEKRTCFWSRSRKCLWRKGETSGHRQTIKSIFYDCDKDALLIKVEQIGAACHNGTRTCFMDQIDN